MKLLNFSAEPPDLHWWNLEHLSGTFEALSGTFQPLCETITVSGAFLYLEPPFKGGTSGMWNLLGVEPLCGTLGTFMKTFVEPLKCKTFTRNLYVEPWGTWCQVSGHRPKPPRSFIGRTPSFSSCWGIECHYLDAKRQPYETILDL